MSRIKIELDRFEKICLGVLAVILIIAAFAFFGKNSHDDPTTGAQVIAHEGGGFWLGVVVCIIGAAAAIFLGIKRYNKTQDGNSLTPWIAAALLFIGIAFGKGCTDKANQGVTTKYGRVVQP